MIKGDIQDELFDDHGWRCLRCDWVQISQFPEPNFTEKPCECCWDFECPKCGGAVDYLEREKENKNGC